MGIRGKVHVLKCQYVQVPTMFPVVYRTNTTNIHPRTLESPSRTPHSLKVHVLPTKLHVLFSDLEKFSDYSLYEKVPISFIPELSDAPGYY